MPTVDQLAKAAGGFSRPSKPACLSYSLPAGTACPIGSRYRGVEGSVCSKCYAHKGQYVFPNVKAAMERRLQKLKRALAGGMLSTAWKQFVVAMANGINQQLENSRQYSRSTGNRPKVDGHFFRWHDSGDLISTNHLALIVAVCQRTPQVMHLLPTKQFDFVREWLRRYGTEIPKNLVIRIGAPMVDQQPGEEAKTLAALYPNIRGCMVVSKFENQLPPGYHHCPATLHKSHRRYRPTCSRCRLCWHVSAKNPAFILH